MIAHANQRSDREPTILQLRQPTEDLDTDERITLSRWLEIKFLPDSPRLRKNSIKELWTAERHWAKHTGDPDIRDVSRDHLVKLRDGLVNGGGHAPATINKIWRSVKSPLGYAVECDLIHRVPTIGRGMKNRLVDEPPKDQRETIKADELAAILKACKHATYPMNVQFPAPKLWAAAIMLFDFYGARTLDFLEQLRFSQHVKFGDRLIKFEAMKTRKLQALPLVPLAARILRAIRGYNDRVFPGFNTKGFRSSKTGKWKRGYYTTWKSEILPAAGIEPPLNFKHFRETMVTRMNGLGKDLGAWAAGHYVPGVTAQKYDFVDDRIRDAFESVTYPDEVMAALDQYGLA